MAKRQNESDAKEAVREAHLLLAGLFQEVRKEKEAQDPQNIAKALSLLVPLARKKAPREQIFREAPAAFWLTLLNSPEAKVRKNTARVMGEVYRSSGKDTASAEVQELAGKLYLVLSREQVQMVRPSYILAIGAMGYADLLEHYQVPEDTLEKHAAEEREALRKARLSSSQASGINSSLGLPSERLSDYPRDRELILVTGGGNRKKTFASSGKHASGEKSATAHEQRDPDRFVWSKLQEDRTWLEVLIPLFGPEEILPLCRACLTGGEPYRYRIELKTEISRTKDKEKPSHQGRGYQIRRLIEQIETLTGSSLVNDPSSYEAEVRVEIGKKSAYQDQDDPPVMNWFLKFSCAPDHRFDYRMETIPASIHPANAAMIMHLAAPYRKERPAADAAPRRILDPCCGSGTLLIERAKADPFRPLELTGLDIEPRAVRAAKKNLAAALRGPEDIIGETGFLTDWNIRQSDLTRWNLPEKARPFDEIYANLPFGLRVGDHAKNEVLYESLVRRIPGWLADGGIAVLYTMEGRLLEKILGKSSDLKILKQYRLQAGGLLPRLYIVKRVV